MLKLLKGFGYALKGLWLCLLTERNFRLQVVIAFLAIRFSVFFELSRGEYAILVLTIGFVLFAETINTTIEYLTDRISTEHHPVSGMIKDLSAGAALISAISAVLVACLILTKPEGFARLFDYYADSLANLIILILLTAVAVVFVFLPTKKKQIQ